MRIGQYVTIGALVALVALCVGNSSTQAQNLLLNPSFELDEDGDARPDGWDIHKDATVHFTARASDGSRALVVTEGYNFIQQDLQVEDMAGKTLSLRMDVVTEAGAGLGVLVGYMHQSEDGKQTWQNHQVTWDRQVGDEYPTQRFVVPIREDAVGPRLWLGIYRSNRQGTITIDNVLAALHDLSGEELVQMNVIEREWRYLHQRAAAARKVAPADESVRAVMSEAQSILDRCFAGERTMLSSAPRLTERLRELSAQVNAAVHPGAPVAVSFCGPYEPLGPGEIMSPEPGREATLVALPGEYRAAGLMLANGAEAPTQCRLRVEGLPDEGVHLSIRKQCFMENWYTKERERVADPLTLLANEGGAWTTLLQRGEIARLAIGLHFDGAPRQIAATVVVAPDGAGETRLPLRISVPGVETPAPGAFGHTAFIYPTSNVAAHSRDLVAADLGAHDVSLMEFPSLPPCRFSEEGELLSVDFGTQEAWMKSYCPHVQSMLLFWAPAYDKFACGEEKFLEPHSEAWNRALIELMGALFKAAEGWGYGMDRFVLLPYDEPSSGVYADSPNEKIEHLVSVMRLCREQFPDLRQAVTLSNYTYPADLEACLPYIDIALPHWPLPEQLPAKNAPETYSPRQAFTDTMLPMLQAEREKRGMRIWSYHVAGGKADDALLYNRAYPVRAFGAGQRGVGTWAYNVPRGTTWDDTETGVDYIFVYDGKEDHPTNRALNPTGEIVVPSIRWEGLREGIQDARILVALETALADGACPEAVRIRAQAAIDTARAMAQDDDAITWETVDALSAELRAVWAAM